MVNAYKFGECVQIRSQKKKSHQTTLKKDRKVSQEAVSCNDTGSQTEGL